MSQICKVITLDSTGLAVLCNFFRKKLVCKDVVLPGHALLVIILYDAFFFQEKASHLDVVYLSALCKTLEENFLH
jgi:ABC-type transporter Mla MlaB component